MNHIGTRRIQHALSGAMGLAGFLLAASGAAGQCTQYPITQSTGAVIVPGATDSGNHGDDVVTAFALPFAVQLYGATYTTASLSSNGNIQFTTTSNSYGNGCLPQGSLGVAILAHWDDMRTDAPGDGIFTSVSGTAPNRVLNVEWRSHYFSGGTAANFEVRLFEDNSHFEIIYATDGTGGPSATVGVQHTTLPPNQFECNTGGIVAGLKLNFGCSNDPTPPSGNGAASPSNVYACGAGSPTVLTVAVVPGYNPVSTGLAVSVDLSAIAGAASQAFYDDGTHGDATPGDNTFSFSTTVSGSVSAGAKVLPFTITDAQSRSGGGNISLNVTSCPTSGPDVYIGELTDVGYYGSVGAITAYSVGTNACNAGDAPVSWFASVNQHPVIGQNMYRLKNGRFEQLGQSWLKHGFASTNSGFCGTCTAPPQGGSQLGVGCSDAYGSGLNGSQGYLGPRSQVNSTTGAYPYPFTAPGAEATIGRRLQVYTADIDPALNAGAQYFVDAQYVTADDAQWSNGGVANNGLNNSTYRPITIASTTATPAFSGPGQDLKPGIQAWKDVDPSVTLVTADYLDTTVNPAGITARFWVGAKVTDNGDGTWHYEYAAYNHNADRAGGAFSVPFGPGVVVSNIGFHGVFAHSGEPYPNTAANPDPWTGTVGGLAVSWQTPEAYQPPAGDNANALRWGTMYNFRFDANVAPVTGNARLELFKPGSPASVSANAIPVPGHGCFADLDDGSGTGVPDSGVDINDLLFFLNGYEAGLLGVDLDDGSGTGTPDGGVDINDLLFFLDHSAGGC